MNRSVAVLLALAIVAVAAVLGRNAAELGWFDIPPTATGTPYLTGTAIQVAANTIMADFQKPTPNLAATGTFEAAAYSRATQAIMQATVNAVMADYTPPAYRTPTPSPSPTDPVKRIYFDNAPGVPAGIDEGAWRDLRRYLDADDRTSYLDMIITGRALFVGTNTDVLVLETKGELCRVRMAEGEHYGKAGWVLCMWVRERPAK